MKSIGLDRGDFEYDYADTPAWDGSEVQILAQTLNGLDTNLDLQCKGTLTANDQYRFSQTQSFPTQKASS